MSKKILLTTLGLFLTLILLFFIGRQVILSSRASTTTNQLPTRENSYIFASPIQAQANGQEKIRINVFLLDSQGLGVGQKQVTLSSNPSLNIEAVQPQTDDFGKAIFNLSSSLPGKYQISASTPDFTLKQQISVLFL